MRKATRDHLKNVFWYISITISTQTGSVRDDGPLIAKFNKKRNIPSRLGKSVVNQRNAYQRYNEYRKNHISSWNVKTMYEVDKIHNTTKEMEKLSL